MSLAKVEALLEAKLAAREANLQQLCCHVAEARHGLCGVAATLALLKDHADDVDDAAAVLGLVLNALEEVYGAVASADGALQAAVALRRAVLSEEPHDHQRTARPRAGILLPGLRRGVRARPSRRPRGHVARRCPGDAVRLVHREVKRLVQALSAMEETLDALIAKDRAAESLPAPEATL